MYKPLTYDELLDRAVAESTRLETLIEALKKEHLEMGQHYLRSGWHAGFDDHYRQRREVYTQLVYAEYDLARSKGREAVLRKCIREGLVRESLTEGVAA